MTVGILWFFFPMPWVGMQWVIVLFPDHTHLLIATVYPVTSLCNVSFQCLTSDFMQLTSCFMQLAATGCRRNTLHCHRLFEGKCYLCIRMGITILKLIIRGGISSEMRLEVTFLAPLTCHPKTNFTFHMSDDNHPKWEFWIELSPQCFCFNYKLFIFYIFRVIPQIE